MKKSANRQSRARLQTLGTAQLAQIAGGVNTAEYYGAIVALTAGVLDSIFAGR